jgi:hypothetical protein
MTSMPLIHINPALRVGAVAAILAGISACAKPGPGVVDPQPGPLPAGCPPNRPPSNATELQRCVSALKFDDTLEAAGDHQALTVIDKQKKGIPCPGRTDSTPSCRHGPLAQIEPEMLSHKLSFSQLREGRIIAKLFLDKDQGEDYDKLALVRGDTTYWWVQVTERSEGDLDRKHQQSEKDPDKTRKYYYGKSFFVSTAAGPDGSLRRKEYQLEYKKHPGKFKQALARWVWDPDDEKAQGSCGQGCCR